MSKERDVIDVESGGIIALDKTKTREELKALMVEILDRGIVQDRLYIPLNDGLHGEWVPNYSNDINEKKLLGFEIADSTKHVKGGIETISTDGKGTEIIVGDTLYMVCSSVRKEVLDEIRHERFVQAHGRKGDNSQSEEREYLANAKGLKKFGIGAINESHTESVSGTDIQETLKAMEREKQTAGG